MKSITTLILSLSVYFVTAQAAVNRKCLDCICQASSGCYDDVGCIDGGGAKYCGPYLLSWGYWFDSGRPGQNFEKCAQNKTCAEEAVRGYMERYKTDCDDDGLVDCDDFARIHKRGYGACQGDEIMKTPFMVRYETCISSNEADDVEPTEDFGEGLLQERVVGVKPAE